MKISCPNCSAAYELDDARVPPAGLSIKCPKCKSPFTVHRPKGDAAKAPPKAAVPLPGQPGAQPSAPSRPPARKPAGAVPLPGLAESAPPKQPPRGAPAGSAVPLPGLDDAAPAPAQSQPPARRQAGAVPLPGLEEGGLGQTAGGLRPPPLPPSAPPDAGAVPLPGLDDAVAAPAGNDPFANVDLGEPAPPPPPRSAPPPADVDDIFPVDMAEEGPAPGRAPAIVPDAGSEFDFVEAPARPPPAADDMLDFVDEQTALTPKDGDKKKRRPAPPSVARSEPPALPTEAPFVPGGPAETAKEDAKSAKTAEKDRKKQEREERVRKEREERARRKATRASASGGRLAALVRPKPIAAAVAVLALATVVVFGVRARRTSAGLFWSNRYLPSRKAASAAEGKVIEKGMARLAQGDFAGAREAVAAAAQLMTVLPDDENVEAFFVLAASELKLEYGQVGADWDQATRLMEKMKGEGQAQSQARGAFALAQGDAASARQLLAPLGDSPTAAVEPVWLYARALLVSGEAARAAQVLDGSLKARGGSAKLLVLRGTVARDKGQLAEAAAFFEKALVASPGSGRALVELAGVRLSQNDITGAASFLAKALDTDVRKTLDAGEEARGNMLRGALASRAHDAKAAEAAYERAVALDPGGASVHEAYGEFRLSRREWEKAARQFEAAIKTGRESAGAHAGAARAYLGQNRLLEADKEITLAISRDGNDARTLYLQGRVAEAIGKGDEAFNKYEAALQKKPDLVDALTAEGVIWFNRLDKAKAKAKLEAALKVPQAQLTAQDDESVGDLALLLGDREGAKAAYGRALQKDAQDPLAHAGLGKALAAENDLPGARKELELALSQLDTDPSIHFEYGSLLRRMGEPDAALEALRKAVKLDSKDARFRSRLGALLVDRGEYDEAEKQLRQAVLLNDRNAEALVYLGRALAGRKSLPEAVEVMKKAVEIDGDNGDYLYYLGLAYEQGQQVQDAVNTFTRSIEKNPQSADAYEHLGLNLMVENRFGEATDAFSKAAGLATKRARLWAELGDSEQQNGDVDGAIRDFQRALAIDSGLVGVWTKLGIAYKDKDCKGCRTKALDALKRATHVDPADATAHHELGYMYKDDGRRKDAIAEFRRYLELRPDAGDLASVQDDIYYLQEESHRTP